MKNLPEHNPKQGAWEDLLKRREFNSQLKEHLPKLPQYFPQDAAWEKISGRLESKKPIPLWVRWSVAASVVGIIFISGITQKGFVSENHDEQNQAFSSSNKVDNLTTKSQIQAVETKPDPEIISPIIEKFSKESLEKKRISRSNEQIDFPEFSLPPIELFASPSLTLKISEKEKPVLAPQKTLHQVSISWSKIKPGMQVKTPFGSQDSEVGQKPQASAAPIGRIILEIKN